VLRRARGRDLRLTLAGVFAMVAVTALGFGLRQHGDVSLDVSNPPHRAAATAPAAPPPASAASTAAPAPGAASPPPPGATVARAGSPPPSGTAPAATGSPGPVWIEATAAPDTPAPPTPTAQSCELVGAGGQCPIGPGH